MQADHDSFYDLKVNHYFAYRISTASNQVSPFPSAPLLWATYH